MSTKEITAEWAAQRIKGLNLTKTVLNALFGKRGQGEGRGHQDPDRQLPVPPARPRPDVGGGPREGPARRQRRPPRPPGRPDRARRLGRDRLRRQGRQRPLTRYLGKNFLSTLPIRELIRAMDPPAPREVLEAAESLRYRDFLTVVLILDRPETFPDNWIYIHEPDVRVGRIQNFKNWSPDLVPDPSTSSLGPRILLLRGGRPLDHARRRPDRAGPPRGRRHRPGAGRPTWSTAASSGCPRRTRSTTTPTRTTCRWSGAGSRTWATWSWPAGTGCTSTTTRTTR